MMVFKVAFHVDSSAATGSCAVLVVGGERLVLKHLLKMHIRMFTLIAFEE